MRSQIFKAITQAVGSLIILKKEIVSSAITTTLKDLTTVASGDLLVESVTLMTNSTGLAGGTNLQISVNGEVYGLNLPIVEAVSNLGVSAHRVAPSPSPAADTTNDNGMSVTAAVPFVLQAGDKLQYNCTGSVCSGVGKILIVIKFRRIDKGARIKRA